VNEIRADKNPETKKNKTKFSYFLFYIGKSEMVGLLSSICILFAVLILTHPQKKPRNLHVVTFPCIIC